MIFGASAGGLAAALTLTRAVREWWRQGFGRRHVAEKRLQRLGTNAQQDFFEAVLGLPPQIREDLPSGLRRAIWVDRDYVVGAIVEKAGAVMGYSIATRNPRFRPRFRSPGGSAVFVADGLQVPYNLLRRDAERELIPAAEALGLTVAAWGPLASGVLSGKFTQPINIEGPTRVAAENLSDRDRAVATAVGHVAGQLGVSSSQVAIAWTRAHSRVVHPILGVRTVDQLHDNLGALDVTLPSDAVTQIEAAATFDVGFPSNFLESMTGSVYGDVGALVDNRTP